MNTDLLYQKVLDYYKSHSEEMDAGKQFHFASRLHLWQQMPGMKNSFANARSDFVGEGTETSVRDKLTIIIKNSDGFGSKNATHLRAPYFNKYPDLRSVVPVLFRIHWAQTIYGINSSHLFGEFFDVSKIRSMEQAFNNDPRAIAILSTHATNFLYLYTKIIENDESRINLDKIINISKTQYSFDDKIELQLYIYLLTHCIIGETLFYTRKMPDQLIAKYKEMCSLLNEALMSKFESINMDNKFEFLVASKICGYNPSAKSKIYEEALKSLSPDGDFIIDTHNKNPQSQNIDLSSSEHRNVLFLMSFTDYTPLY